MLWIVDGMNVIGAGGRGPGGTSEWWRDRDGAMHRLVDELERWAVEWNEDVIVVFERRPNPPIRSTVIEVAHAPKPKRDAADDEIVRRLKLHPAAASVRVVTSDRWLSERASALGATVEGATSFRRRLSDRW